jgi:uncharacterized iron-regulated protein
MRTTKAQKVQKYNSLYDNYHITGIKRMTTEEIENRIKYDVKSLYDLYVNPSQAKKDSYNDILATYNPNSILGVAGSDHQYSVLLVASNGDKLLITKASNYLVEEI